MLYAAIYLANGRVTRPLIDRLFFRVPMVGPIMEYFGSTKGNQDNARSLLAGENLVAVAPGGMREALRPSDQRYQIRWDNRKGFVRLAMETGTPIILAACPRADDMYEVYPTPITKWAYKKFKVPVFFARGLGLSPLPRPVKLVHYLSEPIVPPKPVSDPEAFKRQVSRFHAKVCKRMELLIGEAVAHRI
jgi:1-acyl-sn-glycerol-3-phosphate acyltransferase